MQKNLKLHWVVLFILKLCQVYLEKKSMLIKTSIFKVKKIKNKVIFKN